jgi:dienelactone hydrolase
VAHDSLSDFETSSFAYEGETRTTYEQGSGPGVIIMSEVPGITPRVADFARRVSQRGYRVSMPDMFGTAGKPTSVPYQLQMIARACISREFTVLSRRESSPITHWLRALARDLHTRQGGPGVGAVGMCLTGNFALALAVDPVLAAPVLSQPSLPFGLSRDHRRDLHVAPDELAILRRRVRDEGLEFLAMRFSHDALCPGARFERLREEFGSAVECIEIDSGPRNPHRNPRIAHSVLTEHLIDEQGHPTRAALDRVLAFLDERLRAPAA